MELIINVYWCCGLAGATLFSQIDLAIGTNYETLVITPFQMQHIVMPDVDILL